jgi:tRNA (adenine57-N1/adenine58-N1)-methyltransferase
VYVPATPTTYFLFLGAFGQVQRTCEALREHGFVDVQTFECLERPYDVKTRTLQHANLSTPPSSILRDLLPAFDEGLMTDTLPESKTLAAEPAAQMPGHTGYLSFATLPPDPQA